jgi:hypothetical protein
VDKHVLVHAEILAVLMDSPERTGACGLIGSGRFGWTADRASLADGLAPCDACFQALLDNEVRVRASLSYIYLGACMVDRCMCCNVINYITLSPSSASSTHGLYICAVFCTGPCLCQLRGLELHTRHPEIWAAS